MKQLATLNDCSLRYSGRGKDIGPTCNHRGGGKDVLGCILARGMPNNVNCQKYNLCVTVTKGKTGFSF